RRRRRHGGHPDQLHPDRPFGGADRFGLVPEAGLPGRGGQPCPHHRVCQRGGQRGHRVPLRRAGHRHRGQDVHHRGPRHRLRHPGLGGLRGGAVGGRLLLIIEDTPAGRKKLQKPGGVHKIHTSTGKERLRMETALRQGDTLLFPAPPVLAAHAAVGGKKESEGPLAGAFDELSRDNLFGQDNWEAAERALQLRAARLCLQKGHAAEDSVSLALAGDLQAQCTASSYAMRELGIPYAGLFGACSTMAEALGLGAALCAGGMARGVLAMASGHFCAAERQFRTPLCYGAVRTPTAQWTATAAGCCLLRPAGEGAAGVRVRAATLGRVQDYQIKDITNMGAAMAPAAAATLLRYLRDTGTPPAAFDCIYTGDLGRVGSGLLAELLEAEGTGP